jgi:hypothetical protein
MDQESSGVVSSGPRGFLKRHAIHNTTICVIANPKLSSGTQPTFSYQLRTDCTTSGPNGNRRDQDIARIVNTRACAPRPRRLSVPRLERLRISRTCGTNAVDERMVAM